MNTCKQPWETSYRVIECIIHHGEKEGKTPLGLEPFLLAICIRILLALPSAIPSLLCSPSP